MTRRSNAGFFERLRGPRSTSYRGELQRRRHEAKLEAVRRREAEREELRRERQKVRDANKLKRQLLAEERREEQKRRKEEEREAPHKAVPSASAIERAYQRGAKTLSEAMEMARGNPQHPSTRGRKWLKVYQQLEAVKKRRRKLEERARDAYKYPGWGDDLKYRNLKTQADSAGKREMELLELLNSLPEPPEFRGNPRGTKGRFEHCVQAVSERGGAYDPEAVCAAQERREIGQKELTRRALAGKRAKARKRNPSEAYRAGMSDARAAAARHGTVRLSPSIAQREDWRHAWPEYMRGWKAEMRRKENPADAAIAVSEEFHGRKVKAMIPVQEKRHYHKYLAELGELRKLVVLCRDGKHRVTLSKFDGAMLCANEDKNQLFIVGGDQSVNLNDFGIKNPHETETLGEVITIDYFTDKEHLGDEGGVAVYTHKFRSTNDNGKHKTVRMAEYPDLIYHLRDEHLEFSGGSYEIRAEGIDL